MCKPTVTNPSASDFNESASLVDTAAGLLAVAQESLADMAAIFEAIVAATPSGSLAHRLANFGAHTTDHQSDCFGCYKRDYNEHFRQLDNVGRSDSEVGNDS